MRVGQVVGYVYSDDLLTKQLGQNLLDSHPKGDPERLVVQFDSMRCDNCRCGRGFFTRTVTPIEVQVPVQSSVVMGAPSVTPSLVSSVVPSVVPSIGDPVTLKFSEQLFSQTALLLFGLPLLLAFVGAGLAALSGAVAGLQALCAAIGLFVGWQGARSIGARMQTMVYESLSLEAADC